jgi:putative Mg2+ transporter-C (MgtC) family protein
VVGAMTHHLWLLADIGEAFGEVNDVYPSWEAVWRIVAAALLGAVVGLEREINDQPAGLRTHITVALGAAIFGVVSTLGFSEFVTDQRAVNVQFDVTRVASNVVVGIGFLGAGMIFRAGSKVRNLTTAASLWVTAAIGLTAGVGDIGIGIVATVALLFALLILRIPRDAIRNHLTRRSSHVSIRVAGVEPAQGVLDAVRAIEGVTVLSVGWGKLDGDIVLDLTLEGRPHRWPEHEMALLATRPDVVTLQTDVSLRAEVATEE